MDDTANQPGPEMTAAEIDARIHPPVMESAVAEVEHVAHVASDELKERLHQLAKEVVAIAMTGHSVIERERNVLNHLLSFGG